MLLQKGNHSIDSLTITVKQQKVVNQRLTGALLKLHYKGIIVLPKNIKALCQIGDLRVDLLGFLVEKRKD